MARQVPSKPGPKGPVPLQSERMQAELDRQERHRTEELNDVCAAIEEELEALRARFEMYFLGIERREPSREREELKRRVAHLKNEFTRNTGLRFRIQTLNARFLAYERMWLRSAREKEAGTYRRDLIRARRKAEVAERRAAEAAARGSTPAAAPATGAGTSPEAQVSRPPAAGAATPRQVEPPGVPAPAPQAAVSQPPSAAVGASVPPPIPPPVVPRSVPAPAPQAMPRPPPAPGPAGSPVPPPVVPHSAPPPVAAATAAPRQVGPSGGRAPAPTSGAIAPPPPKVAPAMSPGTAPAGAKGASPGPPAAPPAGPASAPAPRSAAMTEGEIRDLYSAYVAAKRRCNEDVSRITYEALAKSVAQQTPELMKRFNAKSVEFRVVIRDGKAVLKAVPRV